MKRIISMLIIVVMICGMARADVVATGSVNLRSGPGLNYEKIGTVGDGANLEYLEESTTDDRGVAWYKVTLQGRECWISSTYSYVSNGESYDFSFTGSEKELSGWCFADLQASAQAIGLTEYEMQMAELPNVYSNDRLRIAGTDLLMGMTISGGGYSLFGVKLGMDRNTAIYWMQKCGLDLMHIEDGKVIYLHPDGETGEYDSMIIVKLENEIVTEVEWTLYT